jgi:hypothetical protein
MTSLSHGEDCRLRFCKLRAGEVFGLSIEGSALKLLATFALEPTGELTVSESITTMCQARGSLLWKLLICELIVRLISITSSHDVVHRAVCSL